MNKSEKKRLRIQRTEVILNNLRKEIEDLLDSVEEFRLNDADINDLFFEEEIGNIVELLEENLTEEIHRLEKE